MILDGTGERSVLDGTGKRSGEGAGNGSGFGTWSVINSDNKQAKGLLR